MVHKANCATINCEEPGFVAEEQSVPNEPWVVVEEPRVVAEVSIN
jgi:hypothetical protein